MDLLDNHPDRDMLITWIREKGSDEWDEYLDSLTASPDDACQAPGRDEEHDPARPK
jgi:hypothetical protein